MPSRRFWPSSSLSFGKFFGWGWLDPVIGVVGSLVVAQWVIGFIRTTSKVLLDREMDAVVVAEIHEAIEADSDDKISDFHLVRVGFESFYRASSFVFGGGHVVLSLLQTAVVNPGGVSNDRFLAGYGVVQAMLGLLFTFSAR